LTIFRSVLAGVDEREGKYGKWIEKRRTNWYGIC
jgi:hypothetical protein